MDDFRPRNYRCEKMAKFKCCRPHVLPTRHVRLSVVVTTRRNARPNADGRRVSAASFDHAAGSPANPRAWLVRCPVVKEDARSPSSSSRWEEVASCDVKSALRKEHFA